MASNQFPDAVYVFWDQYSEDDATLIACETVDEVAFIGQPRTVAIYKLDRVVTVNGVAVVKEAQEP